MSVDLSHFVSDADIPDPPRHLWPKPLLWRVLIRPYVYRKKTPKGIIIPDAAAYAAALFNMKARVLAVGDHCFMDHQTGEKWKPEVKLEEGDIVGIAKFAGQKMQFEDCYLYIINCEDITGIFPKEALDADKPQ